MPTLKVSLVGREYDVACGEGQEEHLKQLARALNEHIHGLGVKAAKTGEAPLLALAALTLTDQLQDAHRELAAKHSELEKNVAATINDIASRIEAIAKALEDAKN